MRLPYKIEKKIIEKAVGNQFDLRNIDLESPESVEKVISLVLGLLGLENVLTVEDASGTPFSSYIPENVSKYVKFTLSSLEKSFSEQFLDAIKKFQNFLDSEQEQEKKNAVNKTETENAIDIIEKIISHISATKFDLFIGKTNRKEDEIKVRYNLPKYWAYYEASDYNFANEVYQYFIRSNLKKIDEGTSFSDRNIYFFAKEK